MENLCIYNPKTFNRAKLNAIHAELFGEDEKDCLYIGNDEQSFWDRAIIGFNVVTGGIVYDYEKLVKLARPTKKIWCEDRGNDSDTYDEESWYDAVSTVDNIIRFLPYYKNDGIVPIILKDADFGKDNYIMINHYADDFDEDAYDEDNTDYTEDGELYAHVIYVRKPYVKNAA